MHCRHGDRAFLNPLQLHLGNVCTGGEAISEAMAVAEDMSCTRQDACTLTKLKSS